MSRTGKKIRWSRFVDAKSGHGLIVPIDHGLTMGPIPGLTSVSELARWIHHPAINGIIAHKGMVERLGEAGVLGRAGVMVHLNGMTTLAEAPDTKQMLTTVEAAVRLGADAISVQANFLPDNHAHNLRLLGAVVDEAQRYGLPVLVMMYDKTPVPTQHEQLQRQRHLIRAALELGVDAVKTSPPEDISAIPELVAGLREDIALFFSGGALTSDEAILELAHAIVRYGVTGLCVGRNVFQRPDPTLLLQQLHACLTSSRASNSIEESIYAGHSV